MKRLLKIIVLTALCAAALTLAGCQEAPWALASRSVRATAQEVASRAAQNDEGYFASISPARERVHELIQQINRSRLAANYADHLRIESPTEATIVYGVFGDTTPGTSFAIRLTLVDGQAGVDQIIVYHAGEAGASLGTPSASGGEPSPWAMGGAFVSLSIASKREVAGSDQSAVIAYTNASNENKSLPGSLAAAVRVVDATGRVVSQSHAAALPNVDAIFLTPWETAYRVVRFRAPQAGTYVLYGSANGVDAPGVEIETISQ